MRFGTAVLFEGRLPGRDRETLILRAAWNSRGHYEWGQHVGWATREGMTDNDIEQIADTPTDAHAALLVRAADELFTDARLSDATWSALAGL